MSAALKLRALEPSSDELHESIARLLETCLLPPAFFTTFPAGGYELTGKARGRLYRLGMKTGLPDILCWRPERALPRTGLNEFIEWTTFPVCLGLEVKRPGEPFVASRWVRSKRTGKRRYVVGQEERHAELRAAGMQIEVVRSVDDAIAALRRHGFGLRIGGE